jgi:hypothetical protein
VSAVVTPAATAAADVAAAAYAGVAAGAPAGAAGAGADAVGPDHGPAAAPPMAAAVAIAADAPAAAPAVAAEAGPAASAAVRSAASKEPQTKYDYGTLLHPLVLLSEPKLAGKITGMFLDLPVEDLCHLLVDGEALRAKVHEARQVLQRADQTQQGQVQKDQGLTPMEDEGAGREGGSACAVAMRPLSSAAGGGEKTLPRRAHPCWGQAERT